MSICKEELISNKISSYYKEKYCKDKIINNYKKTIKNDVMVHITNNLSRRIYQELRKVNKERDFRYNDLLGCSLDECRASLESKFTEGMNFDNYGEWEIDHIKPISSFDMSSDDDIKKCCHYTNLQPLWRFDNRSKHNKII